MGKHLLAAMAGTGLVVLGLGATQPSDLQRYGFAEPHMGTLFQLTLYADSPDRAKAAAKAAFARVAQIDGIMSDYKSDSELMRLCKKAGTGPVKVGPELFSVLSHAQEIARLTDGALDVSIAPVVKLWRKARKTKRLPSMEELKAALALVDWHKIKLDPQRRTIELQLMGMLLDLGGIAKGWTGDDVIRLLATHGIKHALIAAGGDIVVADAPPGTQGWKIGVAPLKDPDGPPSHYLLLKNMAVSTSGDTHQFVEIDGKRYSHVIDPKTGIGLTGRRSVTVIASTGVFADGLDTALCVLGPERGLPIVEAHPDCAAVFVMEVDRQEKSIPSKRFAKYLAK